MSAFVVTDLHIHTILATVALALRGRGNLYVEADAPGMGAPQFDLSNPGTLNKVGEILTAANVESVLYRYPTDTPDQHDVTYRYKATAPTTPVAALKLIQCLDYQSCETPEWRNTLARRILDAMTDNLIHQLAGYEAAPWAIDAMRPAPARVAA